MTRSALVLVSLLVAQAVGSAQAAKTLDIYFIDVEGGQATLIVTPAGESFLVDTGWDGANGRDAKRIMASIHDAGLQQIDYLLITHFHSDHDGGAPELSKLVPIKTFIDYGSPTENGNKVMHPYQAYAGVRRKGAHLEPKVGEKLPLKGLDVQVVSGKGKTLGEPVSGAGQDNPACGTFKKKVNDFTENGRSLGFRLVFGKFRFLDLGDLVWNELGQLVCPKNMLGESDVYLLAHHGNAFAGRARGGRGGPPACGDLQQRRNQGRRSENVQDAAGGPGARGLLSAPQVGAREREAGGRGVHRQPRSAHRPSSAADRARRWQLHDDQRAIADPAGALPALPAPLPMALDDDGDAVAAHDAQEREFYRVYDSSRVTRWRMTLKDAGEPLDPSTERQLLVAVAVLSALAVWRLSGTRAAPASS